MNPLASSILPMSSSTDTALSSLQDFIHEAFTAAVISPDDAVSDVALHRFWAPQVQESEVATSTHFSLAGFHDVIKSLRTQFSQRTFVKETFVLATPTDTSNRTGAVAATHMFTALQGLEGQEVTVTIVAVLRIKWVEHGHEHRGRREVATEAFIINTSPRGE
ncbi:hypothetical protein DFH09DRAFT_1363661 [Mycena vulgaris]|nr:hypothetical protein DFH09DRAFT_1363661 [Mycena vulgaris]